MHACSRPILVWKLQTSGEGQHRYLHLRQQHLISFSDIPPVVLYNLTQLLFIISLFTDLLLQPIISVSSMNGVSQSHQQGFQVFRGFSFTISCSIQPQYPGGSFHLTFTSSSSTAEHNYTQPAVNDSTHFPFPVAEPAHQGTYTCVYQVYVFSQNFSFESGRLPVIVSDPPEFPLKVVILPFTLLLLSATLYFYCKTTRGQTSNRQEDTEPGVGAAEEEVDVQGVQATPSGI
ncbi:uncharacterized protein LOC129605026 [Betta splendens]|uniref:Uncharacterized protein LOC129605026 n=1 Tax=Betta splendens TaxID=158456 RepID=A0A9W2Y865_BETSP|nr:uncharacterized protein LOC129605026 [Betta splendens]